MKVRNLVSKRFKETPADCQIASQALARSRPRR